MSLIQHQAYGFTDTSPNDIAMLSLDKPLELNDHVKPVCLPEIDESFAEHPDCWVTGWGQTYCKYFKIKTFRPAYPWVNLDAQNSK
jgi:hypothetical protein